MNIFYLDPDPAICARYHCDKHIDKMPIETAQILSTVHQVHGTATPAMYRKSYPHHPCTQWAGESKYNYGWLHTLLVHLCAEYRYRYGKSIATEKLIRPLLSSPALPLQPFTPPPQAMPVKFQQADTVAAYKAYYAGDKNHFASWSRRPIPHFMVEHIRILPPGIPAGLFR